MRKKAGRSGVDAYLEIDGQTIPFELKTTSNGSVATVRDFSPDHIRKWENKHWLIGFHLKGGTYYQYGSPLMMRAWIQEKRDYIAPDFLLAKMIPAKLNLNALYQILGKKEKYSYDDAKSIQKRQYLKKRYEELQDLKDGYSPTKMLGIIKDRAKYLMERGSTLNNPHIPPRYFKNWTQITDNHAEQLRIMVRAYITEY